MPVPSPLRDLVLLAGPDIAARKCRALNPDEGALFNAWHTRTAGMSDAELAAHMNLPLDVTADMRNLLRGAA